VIFRQLIHDDLGCASCLIGADGKGSTFTPWHDLAEVPAALERTGPIAVLCASGQRAA